MKSGGFSLIAIVTLALGIGLNTSMFSFMAELILQPVPFPDKDRLVRVHRTTPQEAKTTHSAADYLELQREASDFLQLGAYRQWGFTLDEPGRSPVSLNGLRASAELLNVLGVQPLHGRTFTAEEDKPGHAVVLLSYDTWMSQFAGDPDVIDRTVRIDGQATTVVGVLPDRFSSIFLWGGPSDVLMPLALSNMEKMNRSDNGFALIGRFKPNLERDQVNARLATLARRLAETRPREQSQDGLWAESLETSMRSPQAVTISVMMLGLAVGVLIIVCSNLSNLQLARGAARSREFAIRAALGASRSHLVRPLLAESIILALVGGGLGILVALWTNDWIAYKFTSSLPIDLNFDLHLDWRVLTFAVGVSLVAGVMFGLIPAWLASRVKVNDSLKSGGRGASGDQTQSRFRQGMIVMQFAAALVQLACATFFLQGLAFLSNRDPGWDTHHLVQGTLNPSQARYATPQETYNLYTRIEERLAALPGAESVSVAWINPIYTLIPTRKYVVAGREPPAPGREPLAFVNGVNPTFRATLGIKLTAGRDFAESDGLGAPPVIMINQSMATALFPDGDPIGQRLIVPGSETPVPLEIVGVFSDVGMAGNPAPQATSFQVFVPLAQECWNYVTISIRSSRPAALVEPFRQVIAELDPALPVQALTTTEEAAATFLKQMGIVSTLLTAFGALGLFLASLGLYGVIARLVVQRTPEIGVRLALGAQLRDVLWLVLGSGLRLTTIGAAIGFVLSAGMAFLLSAFFGGKGSVDFVGLLGVTALLLIVAMLACYLPARRATKVNPLDALRAE